MEPTFAMKWLVGGMSVTTPYREVAADIVERADSGGVTDHRQRAVAVTMALIAHRRNRALYDYVTGGS